MADLRVMHVINKISPSGGAEVSLTQLVLKGAGTDVSQALVTLLPTTAPEVLAQLAAAGVRCFDTGGSSLTRSLSGLHRAVRDFRPDLLTASLYEANQTARIVGALTGTPVLCAVVNTPYDRHALAAAPAPWKLRGAAALEGVLARRLTTAFHALTEATADSARELGVDERRIFIVPRGRDRDRLGEPSAERRHRVRCSLGLHESDVVVLNVGRQERQKGQSLLVKAFEVLAEQNRRAVLVIAGRPGSASQELHQRLATSAVRERVHVLGLRHDVPDLLSAADVFAFSSLWEGFGGAVLEAMAMNVAVVSFEVPAVTEVLGECGRLAPIGDAEALGRELLAVTGDGALRAELARKGRERFDEHFDLSVVAPAMEALHRQVARMPAPGRRQRSRARS